MFGERHQQPPGFPGMNVANPVAVEEADYAAMQAYADMTAAMARYAQLVTATQQQHVGQLSATLRAAQQPSSQLLSPKLPAAKRAPFGASVRTLIVCFVIGAAGGFYARGQLLQQLQPSQQLSRQ